MENFIFVQWIYFLKLVTKSSDFHFISSAKPLSLIQVYAEYSTKPYKVSLILEFLKIFFRFYVSHAFFLCLIFLLDLIIFFKALDTFQGPNRWPFVKFILLPSFECAIPRWFVSGFPLKSSCKQLNLIIYAKFKAYNLN